MRYFQSVFCIHFSQTGNIIGFTSFQLFQILDEQINIATALYLLK